MARFRTIEKRNNLQAAELSQLKKKFHCVSEKLESRRSELAEALERQITTGEILRVIPSSREAKHA